MRKPKPHSPREEQLESKEYVMESPAQMISNWLNPQNYWKYPMENTAEN